MRMRLAAAAVAFVVLGTAAPAQQLQPLAPPPNFDAVQIKTVDLGNRTYMLEGEGGNITVAHTDGDAYVYFADANVLATGDIVTFGRYPNIDFVYGGSIDGMIRGVDVLLQAAKDDTRIVPGHGPVGTKAMVRDYRAMLVTARD